MKSFKEMIQVAIALLVIAGCVLFARIDRADRAYIVQAYTYTLK